MLPLARALRVVDALVEADPRVIPARAGSTPSSASRRSRWPRHSRSCGHYVDEVDGITRADASLPLVRALPRPCGACRRMAPRHSRPRGLYRADLPVDEAVAASLPLARASTSPNSGGLAPGRVLLLVWLCNAAVTVLDRKSGPLPLARALQERAWPFGQGGRVTPARAGSTGRVLPVGSRLPRPLQPSASSAPASEHRGPGDRPTPACADSTIGRSRWCGCPPQPPRRPPDRVTPARAGSTSS